MKRRVLMVLTIVLLAVPFVVWAAISGSAHDFSADGWNSSGAICRPCHTPHNAMTTVANSPLWNHTVTTATFTVYSGMGTMNATVGQPTGVSKLCLSCHDGTVALNSFGGATGSSYITGNDNMGTNLSNDHPISFTYNSTLATADGELHNPATTNSGLGSTIETDMLFGTAGSKTMECASCHDVHNSKSAGNPKLLMKSNTASALCLTCHNK